MTDPAQSLFCGNVELELDNLDQQQREEEEQDREEAARLDAQLAEKMQGAFDDLDIETTDDEEDEEDGTRNNGKNSKKSVYPENHSPFCVFQVTTL